MVVTYEMTEAIVSQVIAFIKIDERGLMAPSHLAPVYTIVESGRRKLRRTQAEKPFRRADSSRSIRFSLRKYFLRQQVSQALVLRI